MIHAVQIDLQYDRDELLSLQKETGLGYDSTWWKGSVDVLADPVIAAIVAQIPFPVVQANFGIMEPGMVFPDHCDESINLHIPLVYESGKSWFRWADGTRHDDLSKPFFFDSKSVHAAHHEGSETRIHLIFWLHQSINWDDVSP